MITSLTFLTTYEMFKEMSNRKAHGERKIIIIIGIVLLFSICIVGFVVEMRRSHPALIYTQPLSATGTAEKQRPIHTKYLSGLYPSEWYYHPLPPDFTVFPACLQDAEWDEFILTGVNDVYVAICSTKVLDTETALEIIAPNISSGNYRYISHSATHSIRFGIQGLKGAWMQGVQDTYVSEYFEIYIRNNHMILLNPVQGDNPAFENLLKNIRIDF